MITSKKGKEMFLEVSPIYFQSRTMMAIYQAIGYEVDLTDKLVEDLQKQMFVQTATWGLDFWEVAVGLPIRNGAMSIESRRRTILAKMQTRSSMTPARVEEILETATGQDVYIKQNIADYTFGLSLRLKNSLDIQEAIKVLNEIKPAHLSYNLNLELKQAIPDINVASVGQTSEVVTVYPCIRTSLIESTETHAANTISSSDVITLYPNIKSEIESKGRAHYVNASNSSDITFIYPKITETIKSKGISKSIINSSDTEEVKIYPKE